MRTGSLHVGRPREPNCGSFLEFTFPGEILIFHLLLYIVASPGKSQVDQPETGSGQAEQTQGFPRVFHWFVWRPWEISSGSAGKGLGQAEQTLGSPRWEAGWW